MPAIHDVFEMLVKTPTIEEVCINGPHLGVYDPTGWSVRPDKFSDIPSLEREIQEFALDQGAQLIPQTPEAGGLYHQGGHCFRWHAILRQIASSGPILSLRRHRFTNLSLADFGATESHTQTISEWLRSSNSLFVCGETGSGKTTFLTSMMNTFCSRERLYIMENYSEIGGLNPSWLTVKPLTLGNQNADTWKALLATGLRLRPERFVVGEITNYQGWEVLHQANLASYKASLATIHGGSLEAVESRIKPWLGSSQATQMPYLVFIKNRQISQISCRSLT